MKLKLEIPPEWREELKKEIIEEIQPMIEDLQANEEDDVMNVRQMARWLNVSSTTIYNMMKNNKDFPVIQFGAKKVVVRSMFIEWLKNKKYVKAGNEFGEYIV